MLEAEKKPMSPLRDIAVKGKTMCGQEQETMLLLALIAMQ